MRRVVVTGLGVVSAIGTGCKAVWQGVSGNTTRRASAGGILSDRVPLDVKHARTMGRITRFAVEASRLALEDSRIELGSLKGEDLGIFLGTNLDDINFLGLCRAFITAGVEPTTGRPDLARFAQVALTTLHPFDYLKALSNMPAAHVAIRWQARGMNCSYVSHGISGAEAIGEAYLAVREGLVECALAGGADSWLTPFGVWRRGILGGVHWAGFGLGEGAAVLLLEPFEAAQSRDSRIYGEVAGYAKALDAGAFPNPSDGTGLTRSIRRALTQACVSPGEVDYVSAHGEGSAEGDRIEARALREVFGSEVLPPVRTIKVMTGHLGAASAAVEAAMTFLAIDRQELPPRPGRASAARSARVRVALNLAFHPMGLSAALVFKGLPTNRRDRDATP